ncbi:hypothetical protein F4777DRAFT_549706 [Nemania sp. FL0916]|nr:hypothetical protein F4777DRAFT_549706 [Nemania sp. FL0916]
MEHVNRAIVEGVHIVARVVEYHVRDVVSTAMTGAPSPTPTGIPSTTADPAMSSSSAAATPSQGATDNPPKKDSGSGSSSPLLFFVALGFGVVFTNLWIIVGVKYCFRYNARNRALARLDENGEPIDLQNMPARPHRRRREKKLMTMDEVNEKFPMLKYKTWVLERKKEGLPTAGGISAPPSRANSVRSVEGIIPERHSISRESVDEPTPSTTQEPDDHVHVQPKTIDKDEQQSEKLADETPNTVPAANTDKNAIAAADSPEVPAGETTTPLAKDSLHRTSEDEDDEDDDHINTALDPDMVGSSGDTCAICIDTLEEDDDVRGLTCGHAFHAVCLDPWLTNRRACCPLCKADYYTPKARPQPAEGETRDPNASSAAADPSRNNGRLNYPRTPVRSFAWSHFRDAPRQMFPSHFQETPRDPGQIERYHASRRQLAQSSRRGTAEQVVPPEDRGGNPLTRFRNRFPPFVLDRVMRRNREVEAAEAESGQAQQDPPNSGTAHPSTTPSQLEAGVRPLNTQTN